ncbi:4-aminobutyrate aminotransferase [Pseudochelatococcus lubricantis]|uniref:4-aminobutyrate aminotransferase n=1 Tax=Pseudochelatococcus lubricantis TaxID=1538102 RepID=A0ABX0UUT5_9HYPH|nr:4-aminobutyrate--2-oxoglutarate transaminase [Pseudochelatococcus lubricantis]NIJ56732.1 4-aminobutyrate aminotransferase [Pseudochelatococcus lubricantis]
MTTNSELTQRRIDAIPTGLSRHLDVFISRAENAELWDVEGNRYIDFASGIAVTNTGHRHPRVLAAVRAQLDSFTHTSFQTTPYASYVEVCERLNALVPGDFAKKTYLVSTGAEAVENAVKIARAATGRPAFVAFAGAFHGRTLMATTLTGKTTPYKYGFGPLVPDVFHVPFPSAYHGVSVEQSLAALDFLFRTSVHPERVAGIIVEPVQGEGGFNPAPPEFLQALRKVCDTHGILLIADEIQTGFGRTGRMFAIEHAGIAADLVTLAKGLGGGFPIAGVTGRADVMEKVPPGGVGGTFAGSPLSCAAALAVLDVIEEEGLVARAADIGSRIRTVLDGWQGSNAFAACIGDIRNLGSMAALELVHDRDGERPWPELTRLLTRKAAANGLVLLTCGVHGNVIRLLPPLTIPDAILDEGIAIMERSLHEALQELSVQ